MKYTTENLKYLFDNLKNGDSIGFYNNIWYYIGSKAIAFFTGRAIDHVGECFNVKKEGNVLNFDFGEQVVSEGKINTTYSITKDGDRYNIDSRFRKKGLRIYHLPLTKNITKKQNEKLEEFWNTPEDYSILQLPFTLDWFYKLTNPFRKNKKTTKSNFCSGAIVKALAGIGITPAKSDDAAISPAEFVKLSFIEKIVKIDTRVDALPEAKKANKCKKRLIFIAVLLSCLFAYFMTPKHVKYKLFNMDDVNELVEEASKQCREGYYVSILEFGNNESLQSYKFKDVVSYNDIENEVYSVKKKKLNSYYYREDLSVGLPLYAFLSAKPLAQGQYVDKKELIDARITYPAIDDILTNINKEINATAYSVVINTQSKGLVKKFSHLVLLSKEENAKPTCTRQDMVELTEKIAKRLYDVQINPNDAS